MKIISHEGSQYVVVTSADGVHTLRPVSDVLPPLGGRVRYNSKTYRLVAEFREGDDRWAVLAATWETKRSQYIVVDHLSLRPT